MPRRSLIIAIDGPSGAGKGTVSRTLATRLGYRYIDTGAMYRAVAWLAAHRNIDLSDEDAVAGLAGAARFDQGPRIAIDGHDVTEAIRTSEIDRAAAVVARHPAVRAVLVLRQRAYGASGGLVMEGRDIGTVVFPAADVKFYLDAAPEERARRRASDAAHAVSRLASDVETVAEALEARDRSDRTRSASPLLRADDAIYIDTTSVPVDDVVAQALAVIARRQAELAPS
jgi:cytidylate kinase